MAKTTDKYHIEFGIIGINKLQKYQQGLAATNKQLKDLNKQIAKQKGATSANANKLSRLTNQQQVYNKKVKDGIKHLQAYNKARERGTLGVTKAWKANKKMTLSSMKMGAAVVAATMAFRKLSQFLISSVKDFAAYEKGVKNVTTLLSSEDTGAFRGELFEGAISVSKDFGFAMGDVTKAMFDSVSAGVKGGDAINFLNEASKLAIAGVTDLKSATMGLTTVLNAYGMTADKVSDVSAVLFTTQKFGVTTVDELAKSIGVVVPFAAASGISLEELGASIAVTTRSGLDAAKTVTALRAAISQMQKPSEQSADLFTKWGIPVGAAQMKAVGFTETMKRLNDVYKQSPRDIELMFGNVRGLTAIFSIAGDNAADYGKFLAELNDETLRSANVSKATAEQMDSTQFKIDQMSAAWTAFKINLGDNEWAREIIEHTTTILGLATQFGVAETAQATWYDAVRNFTDKQLGQLGLEAMIPYLDMVRGTQTEIEKLTEKMNKEQAEAIFEPIRDYTATDRLKEYANSLATDVPIGFKVMLDQIAAQTRKIKPEDLQYLTPAQIDLVKLGSDYDESRKMVSDKLQEEIEAKKKLKDDEAKALALIQMAWSNTELAARGKFNEDAHNLNISFAKKEKKTADEVKEHKLTLIQLELDYLQAVLIEKGISATQEVEMKKRINALLLKQTQISSTKEIKDEKNKLAVKAQLQRQSVALAAKIFTDSISNKSKAEEEAANEEKARIDEKLEAGLMTQRTADKEKEKIDRESFNRKKEFELKQATIGWIQELINIRIQAAANPANTITMGAAGITQYTLLAALATAAYAHNRSQINAQQFAKGGMVYGNSHAQGGERFAVGGRVAELEGGEAVINKRSTAMFGSTLSAMNVAGGGKSFTSPNFGGGGLIDYGKLGAVIGQNTNVVLPVESLSKVQNRVKTIESSSKF